MPSSIHQDCVRQLADWAGVVINGDRPWDLRLHDARLYGRIVADGSLGLGDGYVDGWWDCDDLYAFFQRLLKASVDERLRPASRLILQRLKSRIFNAQLAARAFEIGRCHYDIGNDLYRAMLDPRMVYSCAYWKSANDLIAAQEAKLDLICRKLGLQPGQRVLDIGCGWGGFAAYAAENYDARVVGITVSREQLEYACDRWAGLPVEFRLQDYRQLHEPFDHVVSIGMFEHVGCKNYRTFFQVARRCLKPWGLMLLHTIGSPISRSMIDPWINRHIFPNAVLPSAEQICASSEGLFTIEDWHNFGADYAPTLLAWFSGFDSQWECLRARYTDRFYRMWKYYLLSCAALFEVRRTHVWQVVLSRSGVPGGYLSVR